MNVLGVSRYGISRWVIGLTSLSFFATATLAADMPKKSDHVPTPAAMVQKHGISAHAQALVRAHRQKLVQEAVVAQREIVAALVALDRKDSKSAFKDLTRAAGKLDVVLARDPKLKLAPIDVRASVIDQESTPDTIARVVKDAKAALDSGKIQEARTLLTAMTSEMRVSTDYLPLEIYPQAIKLASQQIQHNHLSAASATLAGALSSVVTGEEIVPLAPIKAQADVDHAVNLFSADKTKNRDHVLALLDEASTDLKAGTELGYGKYSEIQKEIATVRDEVGAGHAKLSVFAKLKKYLESV